jgi:pimeloyl-ACP methyl ester carboxylesterase
MAMASVEIDGNQFHVRIDGREGAPWVMMAHGLATNLSMWDDLVAALNANAPRAMRAIFITHTPFI